MSTVGVHVNIFLHTEEHTSPLTGNISRDEEP